MIDFLKSTMTPSLLFGIFGFIKLVNNIFWFVKTKYSGLNKTGKKPISKLDFNIDKGDFHLDLHLSR